MCSKTQVDKRRAVFAEDLDLAGVLGGLGPMNYFFVLWQQRH